MTDTPNLDKMVAVKDEAQTIQEFLDWLCDTRYPHGGSLGPFTSERDREKLMAEHFGIDLEECERERMAILEDLREGHRKERVLKRRAATRG